jgi:hypothetical protein
MSTGAWLLVGVGLVAGAWGLAVMALLLSGRRADARALAGFVPDCAILVRRLAAGESAGLVRELWPGPASSREVVLRLAGAS